MELFWMIFTIAAMFAFYQVISRKREASTSSSFKKLDDKNFIVNGKLVSFEEDTPILRMQQETEDSRIQRTYEHERLVDERKELNDLFVAMTNHCHKSPHLLENLKQEETISNRETYNNYVKKCRVYDTLELPEDMFAVREKLNLCLRITMPTFSGGIYEIHNDKTAKYKDGMFGKLKKEFNKKYKI